MDKSTSQNGQLLKAARLEAGLSQTVAASRVGMDPGNLSRLERGKHQASRATVIALATLYRKPLSYFGLDDESLGNVPRGTPEDGMAPMVLRETVAPVSLPRAARQYLGELRMRLIDADVPDADIEAAETMLKGAASTNFYSSGTDLRRGLEAIAEHVIIPELRQRGHRISALVPRKKLSLAEEIAALTLTGSAKQYTDAQVEHATQIASEKKAQMRRRRSQHAPRRKRSGE